MNFNQFWNLLGKKLSGEATKEELSQLEVLMKANPDWLFAAQYLEDLWNQKPEENRSEAEQAYTLHLYKMKLAGIPIHETVEPEVVYERTRNRHTMNLAKILVALAVCFFPLFLFFEKHRSQPLPTAEKKYSEIVTQVGSRTSLTLPDGSIVWLNSGSHLSYGSQFGITNRNVTLSGEAFFDVRKSTMPFVIHANKVQIRVLGTAFNVKSYPGDRTTETSLIRGRVEITLESRPGEKYILKPDEKLVVRNERDTIKSKTARVSEPVISLGSLTHKEDNRIMETAWVDNTLSFQNETFEEVAKKMERWYGVPIQFEGRDMDTIRLTGTFTKETEKEALQALQITAPFHFVDKANKIIITP